MPLSVRRMSPKESSQAVRATMQVRRLRAASSVALGVSIAARWLNARYQRTWRSLCVQDLCSDISSELELDAFDSSRLNASSRDFACTSVLRCLRRDSESRLCWMYEVTCNARAVGFGLRY